METKHIVLIGFMGSGKTTVGKKLAQQLYYPFFDTDAIIETLKEKNINAIFTSEGERRFRIFEHEVAAELLKDEERSIIVCGGGTPCFFNTMDLINRYAFSIYLQVSPDLLYHRLKNKTAKRPLLQDKPDLRQYIDELLSVREPIYQKAQLVLPVDEKPVEKIIAEITRSLHAL